MADLRQFNSTSNLIRFTLKNASTGVGLTGLSGSSSGLIISTINDVEATATTYTQAASHIQTISTLGTYAAPSASNCRFGEVDSTNHPGLYEFQFANARFAVSNAQRLIISVSGATNLLNTDYEIELVQFNPFSGTNLGLSYLTTPLTAAAIATSIFQDLTSSSDFTTSNSIGKLLVNGPLIANLTSSGVANILDSSNTYDLRQMITMIWEMIMAGQISGLPSSPATLENFAATQTRATIHFDASNNRTSFTVTNAP